MASMKMSYNSLNNGGKKRKKSLLYGLQKQLIKVLKLDYHRISLKMKYYDVLRGKVFIDDVIDSYEECAESFSLAELIVVLFEDLLAQVKQGKLSHKHLAHMLLEGKEQYLFSLQPRKKREIQQVSTYLFQMQEIEEEFEEEDNDIVYVDIELHEHFVNRGELLLYELTPYLGKISITFEEMLVIRYLHFLHLIKTEGNNEQVIKAILKNLGYIE